MRAPALVAVGFVGSIVIACGPGAAAGDAKSAAKESPPRPYPAELAERLKTLLPLCRAGSIDACETAGHELVDAGYWRQGVSAYSFGCYSPPAALIASLCSQHVDGRCSVCTSGAPDPSRCGDAGEIDYTCGDRTYERCVARQQLVTCKGASSHLQARARKSGGNASGPCSDGYLEVTQVSLTFADQVCNASVDANTDARFRRYDNHGEDRCEQREVRLSQIKECADFRQSMAQAEASMAASRAQFQRDLAKAFVAGAGDIAGSVRQVNAANRGEIAPHQRVELPNIDPTKIPTSAGEIGAALSENAPEILREIAKLHPDGERIFDESEKALAKLREVKGVLDKIVPPPPR